MMMRTKTGRAASAHLGAVAGIALVGLAWAGSASAAAQCGARVQMRYGETRVIFDHAIGACRSDGFCSAVVIMPAPTDDVVEGDHIRIARETPGAPYTVELAASGPFSAGDGQPMSLAFGRQVIDLAGKAPLRDNFQNVYTITDPATVASIVAGARRSSTARWSYRTDQGRASVWMALGGLNRALAWVDCMSGARPAARPAVPAKQEAAIIEGQRGGNTVLHPGQTLSIALPSNASTGYGWSLAAFDGGVLTRGAPFGQEVTDPHPAGMVGVPGRTQWNFVAAAPGTTTLRFAYARPWGKGHAARGHRDLFGYRPLVRHPLALGGGDRRLVAPRPSSGPPGHRPPAGPTASPPVRRRVSMTDLITVMARSARGSGHSNTSSSWT